MIKYIIKKHSEITRAWGLLKKKREREKPRDFSVKVKILQMIFRVTRK